MESERFQLHLRLLVSLVLATAVGCSESKRSPPDDGDGNFTFAAGKGDGSCEPSLCLVDTGSKILDRYGVTGDLRSTLISTCSPLDVSQLDSGVQLAYAEIRQQCGLEQ